jgi:lipoate-protein ligase B
MFRNTPCEVRRHRAAQPFTYADLDQRQRAIAERVRLEDAPGCLLLSEVAPVITCGKRTAPGDVFASRELLEKRGVSVLETDRGGKATYHGPGQWVLFAVDRLERLTGDPRGIRRAVEGLLEVGLEVARLYDVRAELREGEELGIWTPEGKLGSVGVHLEQGVLLHGLSLNAFRTETSFFGLRPCGLDAQPAFLLDAHEDSATWDAAARDLRFERMGNRLIETSMRKFWR